MHLPGVGTNRYAYSDNFSINKSDPSGHEAISLTAALAVTGLVAIAVSPVGQQAARQAAEATQKAVGSLSAKIGQAAESLSAMASKPSQPGLVGQHRSVKAQNTLANQSIADQNSKLTSHHVVQQAAVIGLRGYNPMTAPAIPLSKSAHQRATGFQNSRQAAAVRTGRLGNEINVIGVRAMQAAEVPLAQQRAAVRAAESYFYGVLGFNPNTPTPPNIGRAGQSSTPSSSKSGRGSSSSPGRGGGDAVE
jgi:hypothetical protein